MALRGAQRSLAAVAEALRSGASTRCTPSRAPPHQHARSIVAASRQQGQQQLTGATVSETSGSGGSSSSGSWTRRIALAVSAAGVSAWVRSCVHLFPARTFLPKGAHLLNIV